MPRFLGFAITLAAAVSAYAQLSRGYISGTVEDPSGAMAPGVGVTITNQATGGRHTTATNEAGVYRVVAVEPGLYNVEFSKSGFRSVRVVNIVVRSAQEVPVNYTLVLAETADSVLVEAAPPGVALSKASAAIERTLGLDSLESLPLTGFRDTTNLMALAPTVVRRRTFGESNSNYAAAGQRSSTALGFLADGADNRLYFQGFQNWRPIAEGISEMQVQTSAYSAEFGRSAGVVVSVISRAGTNQLHGSLWDYYGANWLSARALADKRAGLSTARFQQHQAGVNMGGPFVKDKTFFFLLVQALPERVGLSARSVQPVTIPTRDGYAALSRVPLGDGQTAENRRSVLDTLSFLPSVYSQGARFENFRPLIINNVPVEIGTTRIPSSNSVMKWASQGRLDHRFGEKDTVTIRYQSERGAGDLAFGTAATLSNSSFGRLFASDFAHWDSTLLLTHTRVLTPRVISEFRFSSGWGGSANNSLGPPGAVATLLGSFSIGAFVLSPFRNSSKQFQWQEVLTFQRGRHSLKAGADIARHLEYHFGANGSRGVWEFNNLADLLNNNAAKFSQQFSPLDVNYAQTQQSYFFQDDFKATRGLTFNLGVRYQTAGQPFAQFGATAPDLLAAGALPPVRRDTNDLAPRLGFAWSPAVKKGFMGRLLGDRTTVFRGGYGIAYVQLYGPAARDVASNYPLNSAIQKLFPETLNLYPNIPPKPASIPPLVPRSEAFTHMLPDMQNPTTHFYSFSVQRQLGAGYFLELGYVGNRSYHLDRRGERNPAILTPQQAQTVIDTGNSAAIPDVPARRLNPAWHSRASIEYASVGNYNAGFIRFDRKMSRGLLIGANYTFSAALDDGDSRPQDVFNFRREYARASIDSPHRLAVHYLWNLPGFDGGASAWKKFLGGWQIAGFSEWQSGWPFTVTTGVDSNGDGNIPQFPTPNPDRPDYNPGGVLRLDPVTGDWRTFTTPLDGTGIFRTPLTRVGAPLQNSMPFGGNLGRNTFRSPAYTSTNVSLLKTFAVSERWKVDLRASWTNFLNQRSFGPPESVMNRPIFGTNQSNPDARVTLLGLKIRF